MKSLADNIVFSEKGKTIELFFNVSSINKELSLDRISKLKSFSKAKTGNAKSELN